jgi:hypothetical protein
MDSLLALENNPLGELIRRTAPEQRLTRKAIALGLNYKNLHKGYLRFDQCIQHGWFNPDFLERLGKVIVFDPKELAEAVAQNTALLQQRAKELMEKEQKESEEECAKEEVHERTTFTPHLWAKVEREPGRPIFVAALTGQNRWRRVDLPDGIEKMPERQQIELIRNAARRDFVNKEGSAGPFAEILGYHYRHSFDESWLLNTNGEVLDRNAGRVTVWKYTLGLRRKPERDISFVFRK